MDADAARRTLIGAVGDEQPIHLPMTVIAELSFEDMPEGVRLGVGELKDGVTYVEWTGCLIRKADKLIAEVELFWTRKYWYLPLNLEHYMDLVKRTVETRERNRGDVRVTHSDDDGAYVQLTYEITRLDTRQPQEAIRRARAISDEMEEHAQHAAEAAGRMASEAAQRADGWGETPIDQLVEQVDSAQGIQAKGRVLEELVSRLFAQIDGLDTIDRLRTATEEIDVTILNGSSDARLSREGAIILVECKNWSSKCGKNEFVVFKEKMNNRTRRCTLGFLVSWNGFADTVTKEMLRGTHEHLLVVPLDGKQIREAVRNGSFEEAVFEAWQRAVML